MAAASVILVLAYVPDIEIKSFSPLGFDFNEGGELSVWGILASILVYYAIRFYADCCTDYTGWRDTYKGILKLSHDNEIRKKVHSCHVFRLNRRFWGLDVAPPAVMFLFALIAAAQQVAPLVKPPT